MNKPAARLVTQLLEPQLRQRGTIRAGEAMRVALVREDSLTGLSPSDAIVETLSFNGKSALANGHDFEEIVLTQDATSTARATETLLRLRPHVVFFFADDAELRDVLLALEGAWPKATTFRPMYLQDTTLGGRGLFEVFAKHPDVRRRAFGMYGPLATTANQRFTRRYNESATTKLPYTMVPGSAYDAFYVLAYATFLTPDRALAGGPTGLELAHAIRRLIPPGEAIEVGPAKIFSLFDTLRQRKNVDLLGTATTLDFDVSTGDAMGDVVLDCDHWTRATSSFEAEEIPVMYRASGQTWTGSVVCPW